MGLRTRRKFLSTLNVIAIRMRGEQRVGKALGLESGALGLHSLPLTNSTVSGRLFNHTEFISFLMWRNEWILIITISPSQG